MHGRHGRTDAGGVRWRWPGVVATLVAGVVACGGSGSGGTGPPIEPPAVCAAPSAGAEVGGNAPEADVSPAPSRTVVIMGGGGEDDTAARHFVEAASGGDVLILRATGSLTSYPGYFASTLAPDPAPNSVETVRTSTPGEAGQEAVLCRIGNAEAIWLAGGNQNDYLDGWPPAVHAAIDAARARGAPIGGTSAGAVSLGEAAFDAAEGSVTSAEALADPLRSDVSLSYPSWFQPELERTYVDSHFMDRDREGRLLVFLARFLTETAHDRVVGVGLDEGMAMVIENGGYTVHGPAGQGAWLYDVSGPATVQAGTPLELDGIRRVRLEDGASGAWPFDFDAAATEELVVVEGEVGTG